MFGVKKLKAEVEKLQKREKNICTIIDGYFKTNEKTDKQYSIEGIEDRFYQFVMSVNSRINFLSKSHEDYQRIIKEKDSIITEKVSLIDEKDKMIENLQEEINADNDELAAKDEIIAEKTAIIKAQDKEINKLSSKGTDVKSVKKNAKLR